MSTTARYTEIKNTFPPMRKCFFAFGNQQFEEWKKQAGIGEDEKILAYGSGMYGTREGLTEYFNNYREILSQIPKECDPQDVYDYEFGNHECFYTGDDSEAFRLVVSCFGEEVAGTVKRKPVSCY